MPELAAVGAGEALFAETFAAAAPEMFLPEVASMGAEFGTAAAFDALGAGAFGAGLEGLGMAGLEGISGAAPSIAEAATQGITSGGFGAGEAGINAAQVAAEQANAVQAANAGIDQVAQATYENTVPKMFQNAVAEEAAGEGTRAAMERAAEDYAQQGAERFADTTNASFPQTNPEAVQSAMNNPPPNTWPAGSPNPPPSTGIMGGFNKAMDWIKENPLSAASMAMNAAKLLDKKGGEAAPKEEYNGILSKYKISPDFQGRQANPADYQYTPKVYGMAGGGIASFKAGDQVSSGDAALDYYNRMTQTKERLPSGRSDPNAHYAGDVGIIFDTDPDTRSLDPVTAAQIRMAKVNKRANMQTPSMKRPTPMGQLNMVPVTMKGNPTAPDTVEAAHGGIMSLGGYAAGGNPRLLKGPGDGMSDNIPATIANKQPARLADGEFVIPADVVSHLGNGSTDAGAKRLHEMMTKVRKERTGNPKQGKQINPKKFMPA